MDTEPRTGHRARRAILSAAASVLAGNRAAFDPTDGPQWIRHVRLASVHTGIEESAAGTPLRHGAADTVVRTLERGSHP